MNRRMFYYLIVDALADLRAWLARHYAESGRCIAMCEDAIRRIA